MRNLRKGERYVLFLSGIIYLLFLPNPIKAQQATVLTGVVRSAGDSAPLEGVTVRIEASGLTTKTDSEGRFVLRSAPHRGTLIFSSLGYVAQSLDFGGDQSVFEIELELGNSSIEEVEVVSTGYQQIPRERATGSFVQIDNELLNRRVSTNIIERLDGITNGLVFNKNPESSSPITIRGNSTIYGNQMPLIVLDNFPYEGLLDNINPNDIESITLLKDAAAASIWGVRAGNGVIVITTKHGKVAKPRLEITSNHTFVQRPDIFHSPQLSVGEFVEVESFLFERGYYSNISNGYSAISPVVDMLNQRKAGIISSADSTAFIADLFGRDARNDISRHIYRPAYRQQHAVSLQGGGTSNTYFLSGGYDRNLGSTVDKTENRYTLTARNSYSFLQDKVLVSSDIFFVQQDDRSASDPYLSSRYPYDRMYDEHGDSQSTIRDFRRSYIEQQVGTDLLDWSYIPANELKPNRQMKTIDYRMANRLEAKLLEGLNLSASYLYQKGYSNNIQHYLSESYYTRNLINTYSVLNGSTGEVTARPVPLGSILDDDRGEYVNHAGRTQLDYSVRLRHHAVHALAGFEMRSYQNLTSTGRLYGYDEETGISANNTMNFADQYRQIYGWSSTRIPARVSNRGVFDRNRSYYFNGGYSYRSRYHLSLSARRDESNIFGVSTNQKGVPLWSVGTRWNISDEPFYKSEILPILVLRTSYGYNGNTDKSVTAYLTTLAGTGVNGFGNQYLLITNPPNPSLSWEQVGIWNIGADLETSSKRLSASIERYVKNSKDLIANSPLAPQSGASTFRGNTANMRTAGWDISLNSRNLTGILQWESTVILNWAKDKITRYNARPGNNFDVVSGNYINPLEGYPLFSLFSYPYFGLDTSGQPIGQLQGEESQDYAGIRGNADTQDIIYSGTATPTFFGNFTNTFRYHDISLSFNITFKAGHHYRRGSLNYSELPNNFRQADFAQRWQEPGDERHTNVPSMIYPINASREILYKYSTVLVEDASSVRLRDIRLAYAPNIQKYGFRHVNLFVYADNIGLLLRANRIGQDPDSPLIPLQRTVSLGITAAF